MPRAVWLTMLLCLGCAGAGPTTAPAPRTAPRSGDAGYDRVYLIASRDPIDLSGSLDDAMRQAGVVDAYAADTVGLDSLRCSDGRLAVVRKTIVIKEKEFKRTREEEERFADCYGRDNFQRQRYALTAGRQFFLAPKPKPALPAQPTHKPPRYRPPGVAPNPGAHLDRNDERGLRWYAAKDQWHAITHNGEPGTELPRALGYVHYSTGWEPGSNRSLSLTSNEAVRAIVNGSVRRAGQQCLGGDGAEWPQWRCVRILGRGVFIGFSRVGKPSQRQCTELQRAECVEPRVAKSRVSRQSSLT